MVLVEEKALFRQGGIKLQGGIKKKARKTAGLLKLS